MAYQRNMTGRAVITSGLGYRANPRESITVDHHATTTPQIMEMAAELEHIYMARIAAGDRDAFGYVMSLYMQDIYRFSHSILSNTAQAEDVTQETFLRLWTKADKWTTSGRLKSWLFKIAYNICIDQKRQLRPLSSLESIEALGITDTTPDALSLHSRKQSSDTVTKAIAQLPERQRTALMLTHYAGHSQNETADIMGLSVESVESLLARGRRKLKDLLQYQKTNLLED